MSSFLVDYFNWESCNCLLDLPSLSIMRLMDDDTACTALTELVRSRRKSCSPRDTDPEPILDWGLYVPWAGLIKYLEVLGGGRSYNYLVTKEGLNGDWQFAMFLGVMG